MKHPRTWYVVADGGRARVLQKREGRDGFDIQLELVSTEIHSSTRDLGAERPGRGHESANAAHHAVEPREDLHRAEKLQFVDEVAEALNQANARGAFDRLILVAPARALSELRDALDAETGRKVVGELQKDLTKAPVADLAQHFADVGGG
jgi:protein required for attachment to host cells